MCRKGYDIQMNTPNIHEFMSQFKNEKEAFKYVLEHIMPYGEAVCPYCGCTKYVYQRKEAVDRYYCCHCRRVYTITNGTIFECSLVPFKDWLYMMYSLFVSRLSISNYQLVRELHYADSTIYKMRRKIQTAMDNYDLKPFSGVVQIDEAFVKGSNHGRFTKAGDKEKADGKYPILGIYEEGGKRVYCYPAQKNEKGQHLTGKQLKTFIESICAPGTIVVSDEWRGYNFMDKPDSNYHHETVDHNARQRVNENGYTTNGIEGFWSIIKKMYYSTHSNLPKEWMHLYCAEASFRYEFNDWREAIETLLRRSVTFPQVIDIRRMGRFGDKVYDLKKYKMILPECLEEKELKDITVEDILCCPEPVYGILKTPYVPMVKRGGCKYNFPNDWQELGLKHYGVGYKNYRDRITNTYSDVEEMIKDATRYSEANTNVQPKRRRKYKNQAQRRNYKLRKAYKELPPILQTQIRQEFPQIMKISAKEKTREIHGRMMSLRYWYKQNQEYLEGV